MTVDSVVVHVEHLHLLLIGIVVVVSIFRSVVNQVVLQFLLTFEVGSQRIEQCLHGDVLLVEYLILDGGEHVGHAPESHTLNICAVVACTSAHIVFSACDAVVDEDREERHRHVLHKHALDDVVARKLDIHEISHLLLVSLKEFIIRLEIHRVSSVRSELHVGALVESVVEREFQDFRQVEIAGEDIGLGSEGTRLHTS